MKPLLSLFLLLGLAAVLLVPSVATSGETRAARAACSSSYVPGVIGGQSKCLRAGEFCSPQYESDYERYGFSCIGGRLRAGGTAPAAPAPKSSPPASAPPLGRTVLLGPRTRTSGCKPETLPDRRCSPGAYSSGLTRAVICGSTFRTSTIRHVSESERHAVEIEYGMPARPYGQTLEIDHIVSLELGGSNDIANLYPERAPGYHAKDRLENRLHDMVCSGQLTLAAAQRGIATNWVSLYRQIFGLRPST